MKNSWKNGEDIWLSYSLQCIHKLKEQVFIEELLTQHTTVQIPEATVKREKDKFKMATFHLLYNSYYDDW